MFSGFFKNYGKKKIRPWHAWLVIFVVSATLGLLVLEAADHLKIDFLTSFALPRSFPRREEAPSVPAPPGGPPAATPTTPGAPSPAPSEGRPNLVVIMTDDQDQRSMSVMDKVNQLLAYGGTTFSNHFVSYSLCCPSRASFLTGQYAHNHKVLGNIPPGGGYYALDHSNTLPVWLQNAGYRTAHIGKYLNGYGTPSASELAKIDEYVPKDYETLASIIPPPSATQIPPGYTEWYGLVDPFTYAYYNYIINENGQLIKYGDKPEDYQSDVLTEKAVNFIERTQDNSTPFFLVVAYVAPHAGLPNPPTEPEPAPQYKNALKNCTLPRPPSFNEADVSDKAQVNQFPKLKPLDIKAIESSYCNRLRSLLSVDDGVEKITQALKRAGKLENTFVFFVSDNGYMEGQHRIPAGKGFAYEESSRTPLLVRGPGVTAGSSIGQIVGNIDLAPTMVELAGAKANRVMDGLSLTKLIRDPQGSWRKDYLLESLQIYLYSALRNDQYLYAEFPIDRKSSEVEFYNFVKDSCHQADPYQLESQAKNSCYASVLKQLARRLQELRTCSGESCW